jgi:hypothetical protein
MQKSVDWYCNEIENVIGIQYLDDRGIWKWHSKNMAAGVFDTNVVPGQGYQLAVAGITKINYIFVGR